MEWQLTSDGVPPLGGDLLLYREDCGLMYGRYDTLRGILSDEEIERSELSEQALDEWDWFATGYEGLCRISNDGDPTHWALPNPPQETP